MMIRTPEEQVCLPNTLRKRFAYLATSVLSVVSLALPVRVLSSDGGEKTALIVPHTHWEGAVFKTREEYLQEGLPHIVTALYLLKKYPDYRFTLDQMCYVRPFLERYPSEVAVFRKFLAKGRLQIVGGTDTMHDNNIPSGESIVRQFLLSKSYFRDTLGYDVTTGWALDTYGHNAQMPQILKLAGMKSYWFQRGPVADSPSEFLWEGLDGTRIPAFWLPFSYGLAYGLPATEPEFSRGLRQNFDLLTPFSRGPERVLLAGSDVSDPEESLPPMIEQFNRLATEPFHAQFAVPSDFEALVAKRVEHPLVRGELNPVLQGAYSARIELKQLMRNMESQLTTAEKLEVLTSLMGGASSPEVIAQAWEPVLFNERHDISSMVDKVYEDSLQDYEYARRLAESEIKREFALVDSHIDTSGAGVPVVVFNTLGWRRTDIAEVDIPFSDSGVHDFALMDGKGAAVPVQFLKILRGGDGGIRQARVAFIARDIPSLGYAVYHAIPHASGSPTPVGDDAYWTPDSMIHEFRGAIENEFYRLSFNIRTGEITSLLVKDGHWEALAGPGNIVAREEDGGDPWQLYGPLSWGLAASTRPIGLPRPAQTQWSNDFEGPGERILGPVFSEFHVKHALGRNEFSTRVRVYQGLKRVDIRTNVVNQEKSVRYRVVFPSTIANGTLMEEIPFGAVQRPQNQEYPAQNWIDYSDANRGVTLINHGLPGNNVADGKLLVSLMRSAHFNDDDASLRSSDSGLGLGQSYTFDYALIPHNGAWRSAAPWRAGKEFNNPLIVHTVAPHGGDLPAEWGLLDISADNVVLSAVKPGKDGTIILRVYEASGAPASDAHVRLDAKLKQVHEVNLLEDAGTQVDSSPDGFAFGLKPFEIKTFRLRLIRPTTALTGH